MKLKDVDEITITKAILEGSLKFLSELVESDVVVVGAGPAELTAARYLAKTGLRTVVFERKLSFGGIGGGGMQLPVPVVQSPPMRYL